ncbi:MAG: formylglycine-generating enzyme family protein [Methylococcales bacterium]|nr:formylglycine-generating enzyme family protein [Methylococcales bacterium]
MPLSKADCLVLIMLLGAFTGIVKADQVKAYAAHEPAGRLLQPLRITQQQNGAVIIPQVVNIPAGCFQMGSPETEEGRGADEVLHRVCVKGFNLAKNEITIGEFRQFISATHFITDAERNTEEPGCWSYQKETEKHWNWWQWANWKLPLQGAALIANSPVTCVSLDDVMAYIQWLNKETGQEYRLPTESEWEYAARAGTSIARYWGNNPDIACSYANVADNTNSGSGKWPETHNCEDGYFFSSPTGALHANKFGLHDMLGNVWEWTCSKYEEKYNGAEQICADIKPDSDVLISIRGGGWNADPPRVRAAYRNWGLVWSRQANQGFRLVRVR